MCNERATSQAVVTTLVFKNMPRLFDNAVLLGEIENAVGKGLVDFLLLPWDGASRNMGYAFVNFIDGHSARRARASMDGSYWSGDASAKAVKIVDAKLQGLLPNLAASERTIRTTQKSFVHPLVVIGGVAVSFDEAVRRLLPERGVGGRPTVEQGPKDGSEMARRTTRTPSSADAEGNPYAYHGAATAAGAPIPNDDARASVLCTLGYQKVSLEVRGLLVELLRREQSRAVASMPSV